jgi:hypothetical protein
MNDRSFAQAVEKHSQESMIANGTKTFTLAKRNLFV